MKRSFLFSLILLISNILPAQFKLIEGPEFDTPKDYEYKGMYAIDDNKFYTYRLIERKVKPQVRIEAFDKKTLSQVYVKDIILPQPKKEVYSTDARSCKIIVKQLASQTFIFYSLYHDDERKMKVYLLRINTQTGETSEPALIASPDINFSLLTSPDKEHFAIVSLSRNGRPPATYYDYNGWYDKESYSFYDAKTLAVLDSREIENGGVANDLISVGNYSIDNNGTFSFLKRTKTEKTAKAFTCELGIIHTDGKTKFYPINLSGKAYFSKTLLDDGNIMLAFSMDDKTFARMLVSITSESSSVKFETFDDLKLGDINLNSPASVFTNNNKIYTVFTEGSTPRNLTVAQINPEGKLNWGKYITTMSVSNQLLSWNNITYNTCFINNKLCFYYLDNPSNEDLYNQRNLNLKTIRTVDNYAKVNVVGISIDESGTISRKVIYTNGDFVTTSLENYGGLFDSYLRLFSKKTEKFARIE